MAVAESYYKASSREAAATGADEPQLEKLVTKYAGHGGKVDGLAGGRRTLAQTPK